MARRPRMRSRGSIGRVSKRDAVEIDGLEELTRRIRRLSDQTRVEILEGAVDESSEFTRSLMSALAPRGESPTHFSGDHAADNIANLPLWSRKDSRARAVGLSRYGRNWWLKFPELGTVHQPAQPFMRQTARMMRKRVMAIHVRHFRRALQRSL